MASPLRQPLALLAALALTFLPRAAPAQTNAEQGRAILAERDKLFMLAVLAYADLSPADQPGTAALIAWPDADPARKTPDFVLQRGYDGPDDVQDAEVKAISLADQAGWNRGVSDDSGETAVHNSYASLLADATLYTTLEPFPQSGTAITMVKISVSYYCLQNPRLRDAAPPHPLRADYSDSYQFFGRAMTQEPLSMDPPLCEDATGRLWSAAGGPSFSLADYLRAKRDEAFRRGHAAFDSAAAVYPQNRGLLQCLKEAVASSSPGAISTAITRTGCDKDSP